MKKQAPPSQSVEGEESGVSEGRWWCGEKECGGTDGAV